MPQSSPAKVLSVLEAKLELLPDVFEVGTEASACKCSSRRLQLELLPDVFEVGTEAECAIRVCHMSAGGAAGPLRARG